MKMIIVVFCALAAYASADKGAGTLPTAPPAAPSSLAATCADTTTTAGFFACATACAPAAACTICEVNGAACAPGGDYASCQSWEACAALKSSASSGGNTGATAAPGGPPTLKAPPAAPSTLASTCSDLTGGGLLACSMACMPAAVCTICQTDPTGKLCAPGGDFATCQTYEPCAALEKEETCMMARQKLLADTSAATATAVARM